MEAANFFLNVVSQGFDFKKKLEKVGQNASDLFQNDLFSGEKIFLHILR